MDKIDKFVDDVFGPLQIKRPFILLLQIIVALILASFILVTFPVSLILILVWLLIRKK